MNKIKCINGHYYDADKYEICPHCGDRGDMDIFPDGYTSVKYGNTGETEFIYDDPVYVKPDKPEVLPVTINTEETELLADDTTEILMEDETVIIDDETEIFDTEDDETEIIVDETDVSDYSPDENDFECLYGPPPFSDDEILEETEKTVFEEGNDGICDGMLLGWLVALSGKYMGRDFSINCLQLDIGPMFKRYDDDGYSLFIEYDERENMFYMHSGSKEGFIINNRKYNSIIRLKKGDRINIDGSEFMFVPFCDNDFSW